VVNEFKRRERVEVCYLCKEPLFYTERKAPGRRPGETATVESWDCRNPKCITNRKKLKPKET
jgi:hypothetical protein